MNIDSSDISVIIQGKIAGDNRGTNSITKDVCMSVRKYLPNAEIIISTWEDEDCDDLEYDRIIYSQDIEANHIYIIGSDKPVLFTVNHQIVTTSRGLEVASRKYALKIRSDLGITGTGFIEYFEKYQDISTDTESSSWRIFHKRIVTLPTYNPHKRVCVPFNICDWAYFGLTEDIRFLFEIPLVDTYMLKCREPNDYPHAEDNFGAEQEIWLRCIRKKRNVDIDCAIDRRDRVIRDSEIALANNFITISAKRYNVIGFKYGKTSYAANPASSDGFYTFADWQKLYNRYGGGKLKVENDSIEQIGQILYRVRGMVLNTLSRTMLYKKVYRPLKNKLR